MRVKEWTVKTLIILGLTSFVACKSSSPSAETVPEFSPQVGGSSLPMQDTSAPADPSSDAESGFIPGGEGDRSDGGVVLPIDNLFCGESGQIVLKKGQSTLLSWAYPNGYLPPVPLSFSLETNPADIATKGSITPESNLSASYTAPATIPVGFEVQVRAAYGDATTPSVCRILLVADQDLGIEDDGFTRGPVGNVYVLPVNQPRLPDFAAMTPVASILVPNFDVPQRAFDTGFPGVSELFEWFGIRFEGRLVVPESGTYQLRLTSDDGSILWLDGTKAIDNDGVHAPATVTSTLNLTAGHHPFRLDYFQGPRYLIALQLFWKKPSDSTFSIIPPDAFLRPN